LNSFRNWIIEQKEFLFAAACFAVVGLAWWPEEVAAAESAWLHEKDFGVGLLAIMALIVSIVFLPLGIAWLAIGIMKLREKRRGKLVER